MKITVVAFIVLFTVADPAYAADFIEFQSKLGKVSFPHKRHQTALKNCNKCHEKNPGKIIYFCSDWAHKTCTGCHRDMKTGPTICRDCHNM
ncbi:MAG: cytochrome c3 family protein [Geobacteraceae bacterium]|nr:cytochrome c3 family protein [Geobacteraceae bacterium]